MYTRDILTSIWVLINILVFVYVFMWVYLGFYKNTIGDMQNEKNFYGYCKKFEYNHDYLKLMKYSYIYI